MTSENCCAPRVLAIQSHVVYGYVGNRAAVFPLQYLGFNVSIINSVQFSNHTHYPHFKGEVLEEKQLRNLIDGLVDNGLTYYDMIITGYCRSESFLNEIQRTVDILRKYNPKLRYICDPVLGDQGIFYCPESLADLFRSKILPLADVITPNQFEIEVLMEKKIENESHALEALEYCHRLGVKTVVLSSCQFSNKDELVTYGSTVENGEKKQFRVKFQCLPGQFTGTGDLFTALLTAHTHKYSDDFATALGRTVSVIQAVLTLTYKCYQQETAAAKANAECHELGQVKPSALPWAALELRLIEGRHLLDSPDIPTFNVERIS